MNSPVAGTGSLSASWTDYVAIARPGHWTKHVFLLPGIAAAVVLVPNVSYAGLPANLAIGLASACLIASANYVINEWLDQEFDRHHPLKNQRPAVLGKLSKHVVYGEYVVLAVVGIALAFLVNRLFLAASAAFLLSGLAYNVRPIRTKDRAYVDVLSEAINNPIRLLLGWAIASGSSVPPLSLVGAFWTGGAFLMAAKRLAEYRLMAESQGEDAPGRYRRSLRVYTIESLTVSCFLYAILAAFLIAVFFIKYRSELVLSLPLFALLFARYLHLAFQPLSVVQRPENLHREPSLVLIVAALTAVLAVLMVVDLPVIERLLQSTFHEITVE